MKTRIITACVLTPILVAACIFSDTPAFPIMIALVNFIAVYEMLDCTKTKNNIFLALPLYALAVAAPIALRFFKDDIANHLPKVLIALLIFIIYLLAIAVFSHGKYQIGDIFTSGIMCLYIIGSISSVLFVRDLPNGAYFCIFIFIGAWITDIFAYFTGVFFGKHKLIPDVSPKKTIEGSIGGIFFCVLSFVIYGIILRGAFDIQVNLILCGVVGFIVSIVSQIGDLSFSVIKRHYEVKDYGKIFPGHGGVLDRFDSIMAVAVVLAIFCTTKTPFMI